MQGHSKTPEILLISESETTITELSELLRKQGIKIYTAANFDELLRLVEGRCFSLVIIDVVCCGTEGYSMLSCMKSNDRTDQLPVMFIAPENSSERDILYGYHMGVMDYILRPFNNEIFCGKVSTLVDFQAQKQLFGELNNKLRMSNKGLEVEIGKRDRLQSVLNDYIIQIEHAQWEAIQSQELAEQANEAQKKFLDNVSHELRTPLHAILGFSELCILNIEKESKDQDNSISSLKDMNNLKHLNNIYRNSERILRLLDDLLNLSKLESGKASFDMSETNLSELIDEVVSSISVILSKKNLHVDMKVANISDIECDKHKIYHVLQNFMSNAIKYSEDNQTINITVEESCLYSSNTLPAIAVSIINTGVSIPYDELESIFDKFVQSSNKDKSAGGTGLGLAISKEIIDNHKGEIFAENIENGRTKFTFVIPIQQESRCGAA